MLGNENQNEAKPETPVDEKKDKELEKEPTKLSKLQIEVLQYFSNLPPNRQFNLLEENGIDYAKMAEAVAKHRKSALADDNVAVEKMLAEQAPSKSGEKSALLETRYKASIERFSKRGLTPTMIAIHLTDVERGNYPKRPKSWKFTPAMVARFMKDNGIDVAKI